MPEYNKLVRDRIPEIIRTSGRTCEVRRLSEAEYIQRLNAKLQEELDEYLADGSLEELADMLEVIHAIASTIGSSPEALTALQTRKRAERGGFNQRLLLVRTDG